MTVPPSPDLQRLIEIVTEKVLAATAHLRPQGQCGCHEVLYECCPDRLRGVLDAGAERLGLHASGGSPGTVAGMTDHTLLKPDATRSDIDKLCQEASDYRFAVPRFHRVCRVDQTAGQHRRLSIAGCFMTEHP